MRKSWWIVVALLTARVGSIADAAPAERDADALIADRFPHGEVTPSVVVQRRSASSPPPTDRGHRVWLATGAVLALGTVGSAALDHDWRGGVVTVGSTLAAGLTSSIMVDVGADVLRRPSDEGGDLKQRALRPIYNGIEDGAYGLSIFGTFSLAALGAAVTGAVVDPPSSPNGAVGGTLLGSAAGTIVAIAITDAVALRWPRARWLQRSLAASIVGSGASLGYHLGGGRRQ